MIQRIIILIILLFCQEVSGQTIQFIRICNGGNDNNLLWRKSGDTCTILGSLDIYARDAASTPFFQLATGITSNTYTFQHPNANIPNSKPWEYFISYKKICGKDTILNCTDTLRVDDQKPDSTILDSVSVDPITNNIYLGWTSNKTPDFSFYYLYNYDRADPRLIENYKDTFYTDASSPNNPKNGSLSYDITSSDSCDNRRDYGKYKHQTIYLSGKIDTCSELLTLNWTAYVGWNCDYYEIYKNQNSNGFNYLTTVSGATLTYLDNSSKGKNNSYEYFIRAYKLGSNKISSSSNSTYPLNSAKSLDPVGTEIQTVTNNINDKIEISIKRNNASTYKQIDLFRKVNQGSPVFIKTFNNSESIFEDLQATNTINYNYYLLSKNVCGVITDSSANSGNIVLHSNQDNKDYSLNWSKYFTWNGGVKEYIIYRATGDNVSNLSNFVEVIKGTDTFYLDKNITESMVCYQIEAINIGGNLSSKSNKVCHIRTGNIYYPNAIRTNGVNSRFNFVGEGIDLTQSSIEIYNRWGQLVYYSENLMNGWIGQDSSGIPLNSDVYYFIAYIKQGTEQIRINGNITILN